jgi:putative sigma-54 modulation protein
MNINIKGTNIELTEAISNYVHTKLDPIKKLLNDVEGTFVHVEVGKESQHHLKGDVFKAEVNLRSQGKTYYAVVTKDDLYAAIDEVRDEIAEKIKSQKDRAHSRFRRGARQVKDFVKGFWGSKEE